MSNPWPSLGFHCGKTKSILQHRLLTTFPYFDLEFGIFDAGGLLSATLSRLLVLQL